ncbi:adhesion G-protein coupled receptor G2-like isoform X2 [Gigantopelta aegis]|uniref:adhesion G-protein coupled receptor G2-like isoform X2 n=1 Tax=Gigantopelta aegis TaxID=1735272 RepID=UPI001B88C63C|nr:adhesion G-protein coupled receptor G2-like isoform X2 [Gigantopelta aegis]XP_041376490.1 adhesion G-protein coupled receptor G2-like isoform X2 [Gigantopelta aegis]XP_041376491.1 adhesion G-protein coupled receptor G2-like isoform X2 [Gigantopelta aegis]
MDVTLSAIRGTNQHGRDLNANRSIGLPHGTEKIVLSLIASLGTIACLAGLLFTVLTYTMFRNLRQEVPSKILLNLCVALFLTHFIFVVGVQEYIFKDDIACMIVGVLMHYFILSEMVWMAVDAMTMFFSIVVVYTTETRHLIFKGVCFGWGLPLMIVGLCVAYGLARGYGLPAKEICWVTDAQFYYNFIIPVALILMTNCIVIAIVLNATFRESGKATLNRFAKAQIRTRLQGSAIILLLHSLTYVFVILAAEQGSGVVFYYLFTISNSLQGLVIFVFYCLLQKDARDAWKAKLGYRTRKQSLYPDASHIISRIFDNTSVKRTKIISEDSI